jgi:hypothetical protein
MDKNNIVIFDMRKTIYLMFLILTAIALVLSGCKEKEKATAPKVATPCEILDKMPKDIAKPLDVNFGNKVKLLGITIDKLPKNKLQISFYWQPIEDLGLHNVPFIHFTDENNKVLFLTAHDFCQKMPFEKLKSKFVKEMYVIDIPQSAINNKVDVKIGIYAPTLKADFRLKIISAGGFHVDDNNTRVAVEKLSL